MSFKIKKVKVMKWLLILVTTSLIIVTLMFGWGFALHKYYTNKFIYGLKIAGINIGGQTISQAKANLQTAIDEYKQTGLSYVYQDYEYNLQTTVTSPDLDNFYELVTFYLPETLEKTWRIGHQQGYSNNLWQQIKHLIVPYNYSLIVEINREKLIPIIAKNFSEFETASVSAKPQFVNNQIEITSHSLGLTFSYDDMAEQTLLYAGQLNNSPMYLNLELTYPRLLKSDVVEVNINELQEFVKKNKQLNLTYDKLNWNISYDQYHNWIIFDKKDSNIIITFDIKSLNQYLTDEVEPSINQDSQDAKFNIENGRVIEFQASLDGRELNIPASIDIINEQFFTAEIDEFDLVVSELKAKVAVADTNDMGIVEVIGTGRSNFAGSPPNRIHNIRTGAASLNGLIIKPGETFSLVTALGEIDAKHNYLPELVIKGDQTIPEYGGGLCQIGTTTFRAAIDSGLQIVERRNHSYRVSYYEPAGFDATIYSPKPDMRFSNNTANNILIQIRIEGTELIFEYWGTRDGRIVEYTKPRIYNITKPGPTKYIKTTKLKPGEKKCTERPHNGADANFDYKVTYADGTTMEETFYSHYVAWPEVCLIGVELEEDNKLEIDNKEN